MSYASAYPIIRGASIAMRPPIRTRVSRAASDTLVLGSDGKRWDADEAPYMIEPMDALASRKYKAVCFVGPSRTGKTAALFDGWLSYVVTCDPGDMLIVQMSQEKSREYSKTRIDRALRNSPKLAALMGTRGNDDNTHDKTFKHGMFLKIGWPSPTQLSGSDYRYVGWTDYDRAGDDIGGEGSGFAMMLKRTQTFLSRGKGVVESSPGRDLTDPHWRPSTLHEAPPAAGILGIYNNSNRKRWYWQCPDCSEYFEAKPGLDLFATLPPENELLDMVRSENLPSLAAHHALVTCPHCASLLQHRLKPHLNSVKTARWAADGQTVSDRGDVLGEMPSAIVDGYWMGGVAAAYQKWDEIIINYLQGLREYALSGSDKSLKTTINTDQGMPYLPRHLSADKEAGMQDRLEELAQYHVPDAVRFIVATVDIQGGMNGRFVVEVRGFGVHLESWLIDRYAIWLTERNGQPAKVDPAGYGEDWDLLTAKVVQSTYKTSGGRELRVLRTAVDTGGEDGVTHNAYSWYRRLRKAGLSSRVMLVKGASYGVEKHAAEKPVVKGSARLNNGKPMVDMAVWMINTDYFKDLIAGNMRRKVPGPGYFHAPKWAPASYFDELRAEIRGASGKWQKIHARNEALDLWVYALAVCESLGCGPKGRMDWAAPPAWALPLDSANSELISSEERRAEQQARKPAMPINNEDGGWSFERRN